MCVCVQDNGRCSHSLGSQNPKKKTQTYALKREKNFSKFHLCHCKNWSVALEHPHLP